MAWIPMAVGAVSSLFGSHNQSEAAGAAFGEGKRRYRDIKKRIGDRTYQQQFGTYMPGMFSGGQSVPGAALVQQLVGLLQNPGQLGPQHQERIAEAQNRTMNMLRFAVPGAAMQAGVAPDLNTQAGGQGVPGAMLLAGLMNAQNQANEAYRQLAQMQEGLRRQDIGLGSNIYGQLLGQIFQKQIGEANALANAQIPQIAAQYAGGAAGGLGNFIGGLFGSGSSNPISSLFGH